MFGMVKLYFLSSLKSVYLRMPVENIAEDVRANFNKQWWSLCREEVRNSPDNFQFFIYQVQRESANFSTLIQGSGEVLVKARDVKSRRYLLSFA
jgi:hypothetical protein